LSILHWANREMVSTLESVMLVRGYGCGESEEKEEERSTGHGHRHRQKKQGWTVSKSILLKKQPGLWSLIARY